MPFLTLLLHYFWWHYVLAWRDIFSITSNLWWFLYNFFSLPLLARTLIAPWRRLNEPYPRGFDLAGIASTFLVNTLMRLVGLLMRLVLLSAGVAVLLAAGLAAFFFLGLWLLLPFLLLALVVAGFTLFFV